MSVGRIIGSILAILSGVLVIVGIGYWVSEGIDFVNPITIQNLLVSIIIITGGILGLAGKRFGGIFVLAGGLLWLVGDLLALFASIYELAVMSFLVILIPIIYVYFGVIELSLAVIGGIIILATND
ncbi:MAG: hypothetical protein ACTSRS_08790 [Candidatus Helarchaeota archaeon]